MKANAVTRWLTDRVSIRTPSVIDQYGQPTYLTAENEPARVVQSMHRARTPTGEEFTSDTQVQTLKPLIVGDELTLPDGTVRIARAVKRASGVRGDLTIYEAML